MRHVRAGTGSLTSTHVIWVPDVCTYATVHVPVDASAKGPAGTWFRAREAVVYFDHPSHAMAEHTVNIDFPLPGALNGERVALELTADGARDLMAAMAAVLNSAPPGLVG